MPRASVAGQQAATAVQGGGSCPRDLAPSVAIGRSWRPVRGRESRVAGSKGGGEGFLYAYLQQGVGDGTLEGCGQVV